MENPEAVLAAACETLEKHRKSLVVVVKKDAKNDTVGSGTGFIVGSTDSFALVMTCCHCVKPSEGIRIRLAGSSEEHQAHIVHDNEAEDLALVKVEMREKYPVLRFRDSSLDELVGEWVYLAGYYHPKMIRGISPALCLNPAVHPGQITGAPNASISHSCRSQGGCSGAPLIYKGEVIGVLYKTQVQMEHAVSAKTVNTVMKEWLQFPSNVNHTTQEMIDYLI